MTRESQSLRAACKEFEESLVLYYYGDCEEADRRRVEGHLKGCIPCAGFVEELRRLLPLLAQPKEFPETFWRRYFREVQEKVDALEGAKPWWRGLFSLARPWAIPAFGTVLVVAALGLTLTRGLWRREQRPVEEPSSPEVRVVAKNLDFFESMDLLESLDLLESVDRPGAGGAPAQNS